MIDRRQRLNNLCNSLCRGRRLQAADGHVKSHLAVDKITGRRRTDTRQAYLSFLDGWDAAMKVRSEELLDENQVLHGIVMELCTRLMLKRCGHCKGEGIDLGDAELRPCPHCDRGWVDVADVTPERIVNEISTNAREKGN